MKLNESRNKSFTRSKDEAGIAMPVAVIMVLLVSVVGAGLLTFVVSDLEASGQVNRGQQAFGIADAGIAVAKKRIASVTDPTADGWSSASGVTVSLPGYSGSTTVRITSNPGGGYLVTSTGSTSGTTAKRKVQAVVQPSNAGGAVTAPKNFYTGANMTLNNNTTLSDGDILVEGNATFTNTLNMTNGDVLIKGSGNFPNVKTIKNGDFFVGGGATFSNATTIDGGNLYIDGGLADIRNSTIISGGGLYVGDNASLGTSGSEWIKITGGDLYVEGNASNVGNVDISSGGNFLVGGTTGFTGTLKMSGGSFYSGGTTNFQQATITNANIFINGPATFPQTVSITNSVIYTNGNITFNSSNNNLTGTSIFAVGNVKFENPSTFSTSGTDRYGDWTKALDSTTSNSFNTRARASTLPGIGATGTITVSGSSNNSTIAKGTRSYDSTTTSSRKFVLTPSSPQKTNEITFPFSRTNPPHNALRTSAANKLVAAKTDAITRIEEGGRLSPSYLDGLKAKAIAQGNYREVASGQQELVETVQPYRPEQRTWPSGSDYKTVVYYKYPSYSDSNKVQWLINPGCTNKVRKGILVIENGVFSSYGTGSGFNGTVITRNGKFEVTGNFCMNGYVNAQQGFTSSNNSTFNFDDVPPLSELNDPSSANVVSWREVYE